MKNFRLLLLVAIPTIIFFGMKPWNRGNLELRTSPPSSPVIAKFGESYPVIQSINNSVPGSPLTFQRDVVEGDIVVAQVAVDRSGQLPDYCVDSLGTTLKLAGARPGPGGIAQFMGRAEKSGPDMVTCGRLMSIVTLDPRPHLQ
jgi:hypothetical protein